MSSTWSWAAFTLHPSMMQHPEERKNKQKKTKKWRDLQRNEILIILHYKWLWSKADHITDHCSAQLLSETKTQRSRHGLDPALSKKILPGKYVFVGDLLMTWADVFFHLYCFPSSLLIQIPEIVSKLSVNGRRGICSFLPFMEFVETKEWGSTTDINPTTAWLVWPKSLNQKNMIHFLIL